jgi:tetratricopeptide (TPR) repeat protein
MNKKLTFLILLISIVWISNAQNKANPKDLKNANLYFDTEDYLNAIFAYKKVLAIEPNHELANLNSAISRIKLNQASDSVFPHLVKLKKSSLPEVQFYFGKIYHLTNKFEDALTFFNKYKSISEKNRTISNIEVDYYINCTKNAIDLTSKPHRSVIKNLGDKINSKYADYVPLISPDESVIFFTSRREGSTGNLKDVYGNYYEDVYFSQKNSDGTWTEAKNIGKPINTNTHDACVALSFDGNQMIIYRTAPDQLTGDLYLSRTDFEHWSEPQKFGSEINTPFIETSACFSTDTSIIYFSSNKPGGFGGKDLYRIKKLPNNKWSLPQNLGPTINTDKDEDSPFLHPDGITLFFSSKGHNTMGEYDIFKSVLNISTNQFTAPENLGYPINTVHSDIFFVLNANATRGYYSSIKDGGMGSSDIYSIDTRFNDNDLKVKKGKVVIGNEPSRAKITLIDVENKQISGIFNANSKNGSFILVMNPLKAYKAVVEEEGCQTMILEIEPLVNEKTDSELILSLTKKAN